METVIRPGLWALCCLGVAFGLSALFFDEFILKLCGKSCGFTYALITLFGEKAARLFEATIWFAGALFFGFVANKKR